ncbi:MAG: tetratricopeptide repeat protein [Geitlerinemataceae cyanobacterium]
MPSDLSIALRTLRDLLDRGELDRASTEAIGLYDLTLSLDALNLALAAGNRALNGGDLALARRTFAAIVDRDPNQHEARCHLGMVQLALGDWTRGWTNYDARPTRRGFIRDMQRHRSGLRLWDGDFGAIAGKRLLVMAEQGLGDAIQFARYVPMLRDQDIDVVLGCRPPLAKLLATLPEMADRILQPGQTPPPVSAYTLLMSLPGHFQTTPEAVPASVPYLKPGTLSAAGRELLMSSGVGSALRVGLVWAGSATRTGDETRSCGLDALLPLLDVPNVTFFSLQKDPQPRDRRRFLSLGLVDLDPYLLDFSDTAAFVREMDLVISVDTAVVHLAGALGKPVWVALEVVADWRWLRDRADTPWYPQTRLFRQPTAGDWASVVATMRRELSQRVREEIALVGAHGNAPAKPSNDPPIEPNRPDPRPLTPIANPSLQQQTQAAIVAFQNQDLDTADRLCATLASRQLAPQQRTQLALLSGSIAVHRHDLTRAIAAFQQTIAIDPHSLPALLNLGNCYRDLDRVADALHCYDRAEAIAPPGASIHRDIRWERSLALLQAGRWQEGLRDYEVRLDRNPLPPHIDRRDPPFWDGAPLGGRTLLLRMSQGFGDAIQTVRYIPWLQQRGMRVIVESRPPLTRLLRTLPGVAAIVEVGEPLPPLDPHRDRQAFCLSLPHLCGTTIGTVPRNVPYLRSPGWRDANNSETRTELESWLATEDPHTYRVGVAWSGSPTHGQDFRRSIPLETFSRLFEIRRTHDGRPVRFYSLQPEIRDRDRSLFDRLCQSNTLTDLGQLARDFGDSAEILTRLDAVIAVDTSIVHLAGALAKPVWVLLSASPDWRWLRDRTETLWYSSVRIVRQNQLGNWHTPLDKLQGAIENGENLKTPSRSDDAAFIEF